jgi:hypothetical protein
MGYEQSDNTIKCRKSCHRSDLLDDYLERSVRVRFKDGTSAVGVLSYSRGRYTAYPCYLCNEDGSLRSFESGGMSFRKTSVLDVVGYEPVSHKEYSVHADHYDENGKYSGSEILEEFSSKVSAAAYLKTRDEGFLRDLFSGSGDVMIRVVDSYGAESSRALLSDFLSVV